MADTRNAPTVSGKYHSPVVQYLGLVKPNTFKACCFVLNRSDSFMLQGDSDLNKLANNVSIAADCYDVRATHLARRIIRAYQSYLAGDPPQRQQILSVFSEEIARQGARSGHRSTENPANRKTGGQENRGTGGMTHALDGSAPRCGSTRGTEVSDA
jgi:hypothetical protein